VAVMAAWGTEMPLQDLRVRMHAGASAGCLPHTRNTQLDIFNLLQDLASTFSAPASSCWALQEKASRRGGRLQEPARARSCLLSLLALCTLKCELLPPPSRIEFQIGNFRQI
jgi:hypothetical protein